MNLNFKHRISVKILGLLLKTSTRLWWLKTECDLKVRLQISSFSLCGDRTDNYWIIIGLKRYLISLFLKNKMTTNVSGGGGVELSMFGEKIGAHGPAMRLLVQNKTEQNWIDNFWKHGPIILVRSVVGLSNKPNL